MAGDDPIGFNASEVRDALREAFLMASPNAKVDKATFVFKKELVHSVPTDRSGVPFSVTAAPAEDNTPPEIVMDFVIVELGGEAGAETSFGHIEHNQAVVTILDEEYAKVKLAQEVRLGGNSYRIVHRVVSAMFSIDIVQLICQADDLT